MKLQENVSLQPYNTFGVEAVARFFVEVTTEAELIETLDWLSDQSDCPLLILGGGSNVLFTQDWKGLVLKINLTGRAVVAEDDEVVQVQFAAGENWHESVCYTVENGWGGLENLSLIPGQVGTTPVQNIGAYGVEIKDTFVSLEAVKIEKVPGQAREKKVFNIEDCGFGYRDSVFKREEKGKWIILSVTFALQKNPVINTEYGAIKTVLEEQEIENPSVSDVSQAVIAIRQSKLPDPVEIGNGGSFFKNPIVSAKQLDLLQKKYPEIPNYHLPATNTYKIPAGWLIDTAGWKGHRAGNVGVHDRQALVLVNHGGGTGGEVWQLAQTIQADIEAKFGILLEPEINII